MIVQCSCCKGKGVVDTRVELGPDEDGMFWLTIPLPRGRFAYAHLPVDLTPDDADYILEVLEAYRRRLEKVSAAEAVLEPMS